MTLNLTSDLVSKNCIESGAYLLFSLRYDKHIWCLNVTRDDGVSHTILCHNDFDLCPSFKNYCVRSISLILFEVGIPNLVYICILGWESVTCHFRVTVTLTSDLVLIIIVLGGYLLYYLR